jgi:hypothetical protein
MPVKRTPTEAKQPEQAHGPVSRMLLGRFTRVLAAVVVAAAFVLPGDGTGFFQVCWFRSLSHLPCPGCGLSRSLASITHLQLGESVTYHPFGLLVFVLLSAILAVSLSPAPIRARAAAWLDARDARVRSVYMTGVGAFLAYGAGRFVLSGLANGWPSLGG